jgi:Na+/proline symporter
MAATITNPNIAAEFPNLVRPEEAAYVAISLQTMPSGLLGLLICGIFAATQSSMDSGLNRSAGIVLRNLYKPLVNPNASEDHLLKTGRIVSLLMGCIILAAALTMSKYRTTDLFGVVVGFLGAFSLPLAIPMLYGLFYRKVPSWAGWSTALIGLCIGLFYKFVQPDLSIIGNVLGFSSEMNPREISDSNYFVTVFTVFLVCSIWYFSTSLFFNRSTKSYKVQVEKFFKQVTTPVDQEEEDIGKTDTSQFRTIGMICYVYGSFICLLMLVPNPFHGRLAFLFCGGFVLLIGKLLRTAARKIEIKEKQELTTR